MTLFWKLNLSLTRQEFKTILRIVLIGILLFGFPYFALFWGAQLYGAYNLMVLMNLMVFFPELKFIGFVLLAIPFAAIKQIELVKKICTLHTFAGKRKLINGLRKFSNSNR